ncbi:MAG: ABC transporter ATP-binding protein [Desulfobacteraceae bacterium]|nr:ABC transporter ATP-binding protein [Desulfobacteraceae bacterium]
MSPATDTAPPPRAALRLVAPVYRRHRLQLAAGFASLLAVDFLQLWVPRIVKKGVDALERGTATRESLLHDGLAIFGVALVIAVLRFSWRYLVLGFSRILERDLRDRLFSHLLLLDRPFYQRHPPGEIMALATNDLTAVQLASGMGLVALTDSVVMTVAALAFMVAIHPTLTLIAVAPMPVLAVLTSILSAKLHQRFKRVQEQFSNLTQFARSTISSIRLIKAYTQEKLQTLQFDRLGRAYIHDNIRVALVQGAIFPLAGLVANASLLLVLFFGGRLTIAGRITAGDFVAFVAYLFMLTWPMMAMGWVTNLFQRGITSLDRIDAVIRARPALTDPAAPHGLPPAPGTFTVQRLAFAYGPALAPALQGIDLRIRPGLTGIVGPTGSGKTTLCHLLARLYPVPDGTIFLDGTDVNALPLAAVRGQIAYVPQEVVLFAETIGANIAIGRPGASRGEIEAVARAAAIHEEILAMPEGYGTRIGERGVKLSGGQQQRLALARALLLDRPFLIIDDGLSAVDMETEHAIIRSLAKYLIGRTCIIVSHRVAPLIEADTIMVLEQGRIAAHGTHRELIARPGFYRSIYEYQTTTGEG